MPNIIIELHREIARIQALLPRLDEEKRRKAELILGLARVSMGMNMYENMREAVEDLLEFQDPDPPTATEAEK